VAEKDRGCCTKGRVGGSAAEMKRIIDLNKLQEEEQRQKKQKTYWQRIKNDPVKFDHYKTRKQYVNKKKEARTISPAVVAVPFEKVRENIISQITDLMCRVDWQDDELRSVWTALESLRSLLPAVRKG
jgi:hypothetical protein